MILIKGNIISSDQTKKVLRNLEASIIQTLSKPVLDPNIVMEACEKLSERITAGEYDDILEPLLTEKLITCEQIEMVTKLLRKESLLFKIEMELGNDFFSIENSQPPYNEKRIQKRIYPLGVLFHIAAGNMDGLPVYSIIEGLLTGNINILKLPQADNGLSIRMLSELIQIEPRLAEYIYVFDTPSSDMDTLKRMADLSNAVIVWGGNVAIEAVRRFAGIDKKIIEWGHKVSFAYVTEQGMEDNLLEDLARHIFTTNQLLCSSCQGIFIDTNQMDQVYQFSKKFLRILEKVAEQYKKPSIGIQAQLTLQLYNQELEGITSDKRVFRGNGCSVIALSDNEIATSYMYGNCWVKPLPRTKIIEKLYPYRGYLQTVGLLSGQEERMDLCDLLGRAGIVRITEAGEMSDMLCGEAHDGEYPLRRYSRVVEVR